MQCSFQTSLSKISLIFSWVHTFPLKNGRTWKDTSGHTFNVQHWQRWLRLMNANKPTDIAVLHHYKTLSEEEWEYKTCGRNDGLTLNGLPMSCHGKTAKEALPITSPGGEILTTRPGVSSVLMFQVIECMIHLGRRILDESKHTQNFRGLTRDDFCRANLIFSCQPRALNSKVHVLAAYCSVSQE